MIEKLIQFNKQIYPAFQASGNAARFVLPFATEWCKGKGYDIGCNRPEWAFPGAKMIDKTINDQYDATNLPDEKVDYIFSSHCLEHVYDWVRVLDYWMKHIKEGGTMFLYLPAYSQEYWRPWNNTKHVNILTPEMLNDYFKQKGVRFVKTTGADLNDSFSVIVIK